MLSPPASWLGEVALLAVPRQGECDPRTLPLLGSQAQVVEGGDSFAAALQLTRVREWATVLGVGSWGDRWPGKREQCPGRKYLCVCVCTRERGGVLRMSEPCAQLWSWEALGCVTHTRVLGPSLERW